LNRRARGAALLGGAIALAACASDSVGGAAHGAASTTSATGGSGGSSVNVGIICSTPTDAASAVVNAWMSGDRAAARRCGTPTAVASLFARTAEANGVNNGVVGWILQGCAGTVCTFTYPHGTARLTVAGSDAAGWAVRRVQFGRRP
jgi:hypothetical protein